MWYNLISNIILILVAGFYYSAESFVHVFQYSIPVIITCSWLWFVHRWKTTLRVLTVKRQVLVKTCNVPILRIEVLLLRVTFCHYWSWFIIMEMFCSIYSFNSVCSSAFCNWLSFFFCFFFCDYLSLPGQKILSHILCSIIGFGFPGCVTPIDSTVTAATEHGQPIY